MNDIAIQALFAKVKNDWQRERAETQMTLGEMIATLEGMHSIARIDGQIETAEEEE